MKKILGFILAAGLLLPAAALAAGPDTSPYPPLGPAKNGRPLAAIHYLASGEEGKIRLAAQVLAPGATLEAIRIDTVTGRASVWRSDGEGGAPLTVAREGQTLADGRGKMNFGPLGEAEELLELTLADNDGAFQDRQAEFRVTFFMAGGARALCLLKAADQPAPSLARTTEAAPAAQAQPEPLEPTLDKLTFILIKGRDPHIDIDTDETYYLAKPRNKQISGAVVIPAFYKNIPVTQLSGFEDCRAITSLSCITSSNDDEGSYEGATVILDDAFKGCTGLTSVKLSHWMYYIGKRAFANCPNLTRVTMPDPPWGDQGYYLDIAPDAFEGDLDDVFSALKATDTAIVSPTFTRPAGGKHWTWQGSPKAASNNNADGAAQARPEPLNVAPPRPTPLIVNYQGKANVGDSNPLIGVWKIDSVLDKNGKRLDLEFQTIHTFTETEVETKITGQSLEKEDVRVRSVEYRRIEDQPLASSSQDHLNVKFVEKDTFEVLLPGDITIVFKRINGDSKPLFTGLPGGAAQARHKTFTNSIGLEFVLIPAGKFTNRWTTGQIDHLRVVTISKPYYLGKYEVTQEQWEAVMYNNPSVQKGRTKPVHNVSWDEVQVFIKKLNEKEGGNKYRLPTEAEWDHAARAGTDTDYFFGNDPSAMGDYAWYDKNSKGTTHPVGEKKPNPWGLYDIYGNVREWVQDYYEKNYKEGEVTDPSGAYGSKRVVRGGNFTSSATECLRRYEFEPGFRFVNLGFRLASSPGE